jgi:hypothetical protein
LNPIALTTYSFQYSARGPGSASLSDKSAILPAESKLSRGTQISLAFSLKSAVPCAVIRVRVRIDYVVEVEFIFQFFENIDPAARVE